ncbi:MAG: 30S ribosomal protein S18 [Candidatus Yonathbacteria bacterium RIFCSPHIGHO2_01_FULL_51_10]|uniref:Small ribosomal subunit protein bS18 n=1 Tax=Candidatus Yonathbacteria bacterium RIFCSPHIGHO2_01_FULL_51_10 TaxID=1802723 RepID=A0A1G2S978_9BACT|nr:MAG: 30S ribosomal protein S18 [Candidatus Yonathbacteria bacterium RIFCSPHIGHO2_01_FULL_51_10]
MNQCFFSQNNVKHIDYKNTDIIRKFLTPSASIMPRRRSGVCSKHQRMLSLAVKRARFLGLLPYIAR